MTVAKYRKKPVVIEAMKLDRGKEFSVFSWIANNGGRIQKSAEGMEIVYLIDTLEGVIKASDGDYIIKGIQGEFYPCKPDIFRDTYELVE